MLQCNSRVNTFMTIQMQLKNPTSVDVCLHLSISRVGTRKDEFTSLQKSSEIVHGLWGDHKQKDKASSANLQDTLSCCNVTVN